MRSAAMRVAGVVGAAALFALVAFAAAPEGTASAVHEHALATPGNDCVTLAPQHSGELDVTLPDAALTSPNAGSGGPHPLHIFVHTGNPGTGPLDGSGRVHVDTVANHETFGNCP